MGTVSAGIRRHRRAVAAGAAMVMSVGLAASSLPAGAATAPADQRARHDQRMVVLATGERVILGADASGRPLTRVIPTAETGPASSLQTLRLGGDAYVIPVSARPYLGRHLDPSLFDATRLAGAGVSTRLPVRFGYTGATASLPGVTVTSASAGVAKGYLTAASARTFGQALATQALADSKAGWPAAAGIFAGVGTVAADVPGSGVTPNFPQVTLVIKAVDHTGKPLAFGFGALMNVDDARKYGNFFFIIDGEARVSVPLGNYSGVLEEDTFAADGSFTSRVVVASDYSVTTNMQTLTLDTGGAVARPSVATPKASTPVWNAVDLMIVDAANQGGFGFGFLLEPPQGRLLLTPTPRPTHGSLTEVSTWSTVDPSVPGGRYSFDVAFVDDGIPANQHRTVPATGLATVDARYYTDRVTRLGGFGRLVLPPPAFFGFGEIAPLPMPLHRTEYVYGPPGTLVFDTALVDINSFFDPGFVDDDVQTADPGSSRTATWLRDPFTVGVSDSSVADPFPLCAACRSATGMTFLANLIDNVPTHDGFLFGSPDGTPVAHFRVYRDDVLLLSEPDSLGDVFTVPQASGTYRVHLDADRSFIGSSLSTSTATDVTFVSAAGQGNPMPPNWFCLTAATCRILPVLRAEVNLHQTMQGTLPVGTPSADVSVEHIRGAATPAITSVTVQIRRTGTTAWTSLPVTALSNGRYRVTLGLQPAQVGHAFDLRVSATDAAGGILHQTTTRAFVVSG